MIATTGAEHAAEEGQEAGEAAQGLSRTNHLPEEKLVLWAQSILRELAPPGLR